MKYLSNPSNSGKETYEKIFSFGFGGARADCLGTHRIQSRRWVPRLR
jgi:hypothetical protein